MSYEAADDRYDQISYRRTGRSGLKLPAISLGLWHNFGDDKPLETQRAILRRAFDLGRHPLRSCQQLRAALRLGRGQLRADLPPGLPPVPRRADHLHQGRLRHVARPVRRVGFAQVPPRQPGPVADADGRSTTSTSSTPTGSTPTLPLEETMGALDHAVRSGKALYAGISSYSPERTAEAAAILRAMGTPLLIHQPSYSMLNRWIEGGLLDTLEQVGAGCIAFSPLAQGMLTDKYLNGIPEGSRASQGKSLSTDLLTDETLDHVRALNEIASEARAVARADGARLDAARPPGHLRADRRQQRRPARGQPRRPRTRSTSAMTSWPPSTRTPSRPASTSGRPPAASEKRAHPGRRPGWARPCRSHCRGITVRSVYTHCLYSGSIGWDAW